MVHMLYGPEAKRDRVGSLLGGTLTYGWRISRTPSTFPIAETIKVTTASYCGANVITVTLPTYTNARGLRLHWFMYTVGREIYIGKMDHGAFLAREKVLQ